MNQAETNRVAWRTLFHRLQTSSNAQIELLRIERGALSARVAELEAEVARLGEALKMAVVAIEWSKDPRGEMLRASMRATGQQQPSPANDAPGAGQSAGVVEMVGLARIDCEQLLVAVSDETLRFAAEHHPDLWDGSAESADGPVVKITDLRKFMAAVCAELNAEHEDGSTLATRMLDNAIRAAVENGCDGVDHERDQSTGPRQGTAQQEQKP